jgi:hypothetical protein
MDRVFWSSFMEGFTGGGMMSIPEQPGAATQVFADPPIEPNALREVREILRPEIGDQGVEAVAETIRRYKEKMAHGAPN